ncbi:helix-turn-helix transcriptional regulator [Rhodovulum sp. YNF3179]|uniref:helix-turn-helix transcriptional regulator n=1 Tax=Rhodovulum sp. YNF3179 TaxID=3425127 RepID=UPI003D337F92
MTNPLSNLFTEQQYADLRRVSRRTVQRDRALRKGPPFIKIGRRIYYRPEAIEAWLLANEEIPVRSGITVKA